jgi:hypothetical protein
MDFYGSGLSDKINGLIIISIFLLYIREHIIFRFTTTDWVGKRMEDVFFLGGGGRMS